MTCYNLCARNPQTEVEKKAERNKVIEVLDDLWRRVSIKERESFVASWTLYWEDKYVRIIRCPSRAVYVPYKDIKEHRNYLEETHALSHRCNHTHALEVYITTYIHQHAHAHAHVYAHTKKRATTHITWPPARDAQEEFWRPNCPIACHTLATGQRVSSVMYWLLPVYCGFFWNIPPCSKKTGWLTLLIS